MTVQDLQFALMEGASFNDFDGKRVVADLREHPELWQGAIMKRDDLIPLRDIADGDWNVDTLYILPKPGKARELQHLTEAWSADEVFWIGGEEACSKLGTYNPELRNNAHAVLVVWWD